MSNHDLKLALEIAAKTTGREDIADLGAKIETLGPISKEVEQETQSLAKRMQELAGQRELINQFTQSKEALLQLEQATVLSRDKLEQLRKAQVSGSGDAEAFANKERLLASEVKQLERQLVSQAATHSRLTVALKASGVDSSQLATAQNRLQREITETANRSEQLARELTGAGSSAGGFTSRIGSLATSITALVGTYLGVQTLKDQLVAMFSAGDKAEQLGIQLKAVMGSIQGGNEATAWIKQFAKNTPLQLNEVTETFVRLKAMGLDPMDGTMQAVVDQSSKLGLGFEGVQSISLALGQAWSKGKLQGDDMLQMVERGVPVMALLEKATGKNTAELQKMSEQGLLGRDVIKALIAEMGASSTGAAAAQMGTLSGLLSNLGDSWTDFQTSVANSGALDWLKSQLRQLTETITQMTKDGSLKQWAQEISDGIVKTADAIKTAAVELWDWKDKLVTVGQTWVGLKVASWSAEVLRFAASWKNVGSAISSVASTSPLLAALSNPVVAIGVVLAGTTKLALDLAKAMFDLTEGQEIRNRNAENERALNQQLITQGNQLIAQNGQYGDLQYQTADAIKYMSDADRERYKQALDGNKNYIAGQLQVNAALERAGLLTDEQRQQTESATAAMRQAYADFADGEKLHLEQASKSVNDYVADVQKAKSEAEGLANSSLGGVFKTAGLDFEQISGRVGTTVQTFVKGLQQMEQATSVTGTAINAYLTKAFDGTKNKAELDAVISKMDTLHNQGKLVGDDYVSSLGAAANAAKALSATSSEAGQTYINLLKQQKAAAEEAYKTTGLDQYKSKIGEISQAIDKATNTQKKNVAASNDMEQAFADLGMKSAAQLEELASKAASAYSKMSSSGSTSLSQQKEAFLAYAEAEIQAANASGRLPSAMLQSQAAALGLSTELEALNTKLNTVGGDSLITASALDKLGTSAKDTGDKVSGAGKSAEGFTKQGHMMRELVPALAAETIDLGKASEYAGMSVKDLSAEIDKQEAAYRRNMVSARNLAGERATQTGDWIYNIQAQSAATKRYYVELAKATLEVKNLQTALDANPSENLINKAEAAIRKHKQLGEENLSGLKSAIDSARQKMDALNDSVQSTLDSLRDELDEMNNNQAAIENRRYQTQVAELEDKMAEARAWNDTQAIAKSREALRIAQQIHNQKMDTIKAEQAAAKAEAAATTNKPDSGSSSDVISSPASTSTKTITVELKSAAGNADISVNSESDLNNLLNIIKQQGMRTS